MKIRERILILLLVSVLMFSGGFLVLAKEREDPHEICYKYYTSIRVEEGDTLWEIAGRYLCKQSGSRDSYIQELMRLNGLTGDRLEAGQYLTVFYYSTEYK